MGILREDGSMEWTDFYEDEANPGYGYYRIVFQYHDNAEELAQADAKIRSVCRRFPENQTQRRSSMSMTI